MQACKDQLKALNLDYIDLYLIHAPWCVDPETGKHVDYDIVELWHELEKLVDLGLVRSLGVSNFNSDQCERLVKNCKKHQPQVNQIESHIWFHQTELLEKLTKLKIHMSAYLVCGRGNRINGQELLKDEYLNKLAKDKYKTTPANFSIKFQTQRGVSAIVKAQSGENQWKNLENFFVFEGQDGENKNNEFEIDEEDFQDIYKLPQIRGITYADNKGAPNWPGYGETF